MKKSDILTMVKADLHISTNAYDEMLNHFIEASKKSLEIKGIHFDNDISIADGTLISNYACYMYRARKQEQSERVPRWLQIIINERLFSEKVGGDD